MASNFNSPEGNLEDYFVDEYFLIDQFVGDTLSTWGRNVYGQLGINDTTQRNTPVTTFAGGTNWKQVSAGYIHCAAIKTDGTLWTWGRNVYGNLGTNDTTDRITPVTTFAGGTNWKQVTAGYGNDTIAIKTDGTLWTWGNNAYGNLGTNDTTDRITPVTTLVGGTNWKQVSGGTRAAAIKTDGTLWTWGRNSYGQLGTNDTANRCTPVTTFAGGTNWKQVITGRGQTAAIKTDGTLWTWGNNSRGALGTNDGTQKLTPVTTFAGGTNWKSVADGHTFFNVLAIKTDGTLWTWGFNDYGQLGINDTTDRATPVTTFAGGTNWKQVSGGLSAAAIKTDGTLWTWGRNYSGELGVNDSSTNRPTPVTTFAGGTNWKQVQINYGICAAITSGTDPTFFVS